jgi:hypothetical protein
MAPEAADRRVPPEAVRRHWRAWSVAAGMGIAAFYTVTPLTGCVMVAGGVIIPLFGRGLAKVERRWLTAVVIATLVAHLAAIGVLFLRDLPNHDDQFVGATSGDGAYTMSRALRAREILRGSTTNLYDFFVAFDEYGRNSYVAAATAVQVIFGPTPYSLRLLNTLLFTVGALLLFRLCHSAFGALPAFGGLAVVLCWPSLFAWSISLLKEPLYFLLSSLILVGAVSIVRRPRWRSRALSLAVAVSAAALVQNLRTGALPLAAAGLATGFLCRVMLTSKRTLAMGMALFAVLLTIVLSRPAVGDRVFQGLEAAAKTHTGHVFTVGHDYKLLDAGFYVNPQTPSASTMTLTGDEATRFVVRALVSFIFVPVPWQLKSARELAYLPEQMAWYALVLLLPVGIVAGWRRDPLVTCMLVGYVAPTAVALALTNGNVGTLLRLRGLVVPYLAWISVVGFCAALGTLGRKDNMPFFDDKGRLFGRVNLFDAAIAGFVIVLVPIAYGTFLLFRVPAPHISSVTRVPITREERRVAQGGRLTAKLKVRGSGLRPMLQASIGDTRSLGFVFEDPNSADVMVGEVPPGTHDLVLYDGVQEVARLPKSVTIESSAPPRIAGVGTLIHLEKATAEALVPGSLFPGGPQDAIVKLGTARAEGEGRWQRAAEILMSCDPDPNEEGCAVGGVATTVTPPPIIRLSGPTGASVSFALREVLPAAAPARVNAHVRVSAEPEVLDLVRTGDRDDCLDDRAATVLAVRRPRAGAMELDVTLRLGVDPSPDGPRYRGRAIKAGAPFTLTTDLYVLKGTLLQVGDGPESASK